jgi:hypothetical protein
VRGERERRGFELEFRKCVLDPAAQRPKGASDARFANALRPQGEGRGALLVCELVRRHLDRRGDRVVLKVEVSGCPASS